MIQGINLTIPIAGNSLVQQDTAVFKGFQRISFNSKRFQRFFEISGHIKSHTSINSKARKTS